MTTLHVYVDTYENYKTLYSPFLDRLEQLLRTADQSLLMYPDAWIWGVFEVPPTRPNTLGEYTNDIFTQVNPQAVAMCLIRENATTVEVYNVVVAPQVRGKGIATTLLNTVRSNLAGKTFWLGVLFNNPFFESAVRSYVKAGFGRPRMSTCPPFTPIARPIPFLELTTGAPSDKEADVARSLELRKQFMSVRLEEEVSIPWRTLSQLATLSEKNENEVSGALTKRRWNSTYDNPLLMEPEERWGSMELRDPHSGPETLFVGIPEGAPGFTTYKDLIPFHTHPLRTYQKYELQSELSADFPSEPDLIVCLTTLQPSMMVSHRGVFFYQITPVLSMFLNNTQDTTLRNEIVSVIEGIIGNIQQDLRWTRGSKRMQLDLPGGDTDYMQLDDVIPISQESRYRTRLLEKFYNDLTVASILEFLTEEARTEILSRLNVTDDQTIFVIDVIQPPLPSSGNLTLSACFPT